MSGTKIRQKVEREICTAVVDALLAAGYDLAVFDTEEHTHTAHDRAATLAALFLTDEDWLLVYKHGDTDPEASLTGLRPTFPNALGWVRFVYGNDGWDVISDYTTNLEAVIGEGTDVQKLVDKWAD